MDEEQEASQSTKTQEETMDGVQATAGTKEQPAVEEGHENTENQTEPNYAIDTVQVDVQSTNVAENVPDEVRSALTGHEQANVQVENGSSPEGAIGGHDVTMDLNIAGRMCQT